LFDPVIASSARLGAGLDWKTSLQELTAAEILGVPEYHVEESGPDHQKSFRAWVKIGGRTYGEGEGRSKKEAEQQAAEAAWTLISQNSASAAAGATAAEGAAEQTTAADGLPADPADPGGPGPSGPGANGPGPQRRS
jgi:ribonuclease III